MDTIQYKVLLPGETNEKLLSIVGNSLKKGRRYFGSSAASLTHQIDNPIYRDTDFDRKIANIGLEGERKTTLKLKEWMKDKPNVVLIDSIHIKGMGKEEIDEEGVMDAGDTDHLLIIGNHLIIIDSKAWKKSTYKVLETGQILRSNKPFPGGNVKITNAIYLWKNYLKDYPISAEGIIIITNEEAFVTRDFNWHKQQFKLTNYSDLYKWLDGIYNKSGIDKESIYVDLVAEIAKCCVKPYNAMKEKLGGTYNLLRGGNK